MAKQPAAGWALRRGMLTHGTATAWNYFVDAARYEQANLIVNISCRTLVCDAENDDISAFSKTSFDLLAYPEDSPENRTFERPRQVNACRGVIWYSPGPGINRCRPASTTRNTARGLSTPECQNL
jgi:hypothetical protein